MCLSYSLNWSFNADHTCFSMRPRSDKFVSFTVNFIVVLTCPAGPVSVHSKLLQQSGSSYSEKSQKADLYAGNTEKLVR